MKDAHTMMNQEDDVNANSSKYASLTAGLLARKGEAVPAAAAFTAEAIAQHIPARRLAQEAERVLIDRHPVVDNVAEPGAAAEREIGPESRGSQVVAEHRDMIEQAFNESAADEDFHLATGNALDLPEQELQTELDLPGQSLGEKRELDLPVTGSSFSGDPARAEQRDDSASPDLSHGDENWFDDIVSSAISEAEEQRPEGKESERESSGSGGKSLSNILATLGAGLGVAKSDSETPKADVSDKQSGNASPPAVTSDAQGVGCGEKASKVRQAIKSGKPGIATRSAMRLDPRRYIRLSLAAQKLELTSQELMVAALDTYLDALDEEVFSDCACMKKGLI